LKVFADTLGYEQKKFMNFNKLWFPGKPVHVQLGTISENARIGDCHRCAKFHACIKKCTICLKFRAMPPDYCTFPSEVLVISDLRSYMNLTFDNALAQQGTSSAFPLCDMKLQPEKTVA